MMWDVIVVGAGLSGLTASRHLAAAGLKVLVVEKSRGLGGRLATRRVQNTVVDHGCRFLEPFVEAEHTLFPELLATGVLQPWTPTVFRLDETNQLHREANSGTYYICPEGMSSVAKVLAHGLPIQRQCLVTTLLPTDAGWTVVAESSRELTTTTLSARAVLLAIPAPQIVPILTPSLATVPALASLLGSIGRVKFAPVITVLAGYGEAEPAKLKGHPFGADGWMLSCQSSTGLWWAGLDSRKRPGSLPPTVVLHSSAKFAETYLDSDDLRPAGQALLQAGASILGPWLASPIWSQVHRWRYAFVNIPAEAEVLKADTSFPLVCCGDWCGQDDTHTALYSGRQAAARILQLLQSD